MKVACIVILLILNACSYTMHGPVLDKTKGKKVKPVVR